MCNGIDNVSVVLPSLNPSDKFDRVIDGLLEAGFKDIIIIDDGSRDENKSHFQRAAKNPQCQVLTHEVNRGKGAGLKTAFSYILENRPHSIGVITIDGDGQHLTKDIVSCAKALKDEKMLVMGCRNFNQENVPARSSMGNRITSAVFRICCGIKLSDTQTGLRGIPRCLLSRLLEVKGERFEYETNMLLELSRQGVRLLEVPIETVYEDDNSESHFRPIVDSLRIYRFIILYALSSLSGTLADLLVFYIAMKLLGRVSHETAILIATVIARACSSFLNFNLNNKLVFHGKGGYARTLLRYYMLCIPQLLVSAGLVALLSHIFGTEASFITTLIKACVDTVLFFLSFRIQQSWVFKSDK